MRTDRLGVRVNRLAFAGEVCADCCAKPLVQDQVRRAGQRRLEAARDQDGEPLRVVTLPMPSPVVFDGERLPASYANFYIANGVVIVPTFNDPADRVALNTLADLFPDRDVVGVHCVDLILGLGTLHCLSQQQPAAPVAKP